MNILAYHEKIDLLGRENTNMNKHNDIYEDEINDQKQKFKEDVKELEETIQANAETKAGLDREIREMKEKLDNTRKDHRLNMTHKQMEFDEKIEEQE